MLNVKRQELIATRCYSFNTKHVSLPPAHMLKVSSLDDNTIWKGSGDLGRWGGLLEEGDHPGRVFEGILSFTVSISLLPLSDAGE